MDSEWSMQCVNMQKLRDKTKMMSVYQIAVYHAIMEVYKIIDNSSSEQIQKKHLRKYANIFIKIPEKPMKRCSGFTYTESSHNANFCIS